jgi:hypothetical protein
MRAHRYSLGLQLKILEMTPPLTLILFGVTITSVLFTKGVVQSLAKLIFKKSHSSQINNENMRIILLFDDIV